MVMAIMMMLLQNSIISLALVSSSLIAKDREFSLSILQHSNQAEYIVQSGSLKSKLTFPTSIISLKTQYIQSLTNTISVGAFIETPLTKKEKVGEDFDWSGDSLTIYSSSQNRVDKYSKVGLIGRYKYNPNIILNIIYAKSIYNMIWSNTQQIDYTANTSSSLAGDTLKYEIIKNIFTFSPSYTHNFEKYNITFSPQVSWVYADTTDNHLLRNFYTKQNNKGIGYGLKLKTVYNISKKISIGAGFKYSYFKDKDSSTYYYTSTDIHYQTIQSSYKDIEKIYSLQVKIKL